MIHDMSSFGSFFDPLGMESTGGDLSGETEFTDPDRLLRDRSICILRTDRSHDSQIDTTIVETKFARDIHEDIVLMEFVAQISLHDSDDEIDTLMIDADTLTLREGAITFC